MTINSKTKEVTRSGMYWALAHYSRVIRRGARRIESESRLENVMHAAFRNPDGAMAAILTNAGAGGTVCLQIAGATAEVSLPADSITTLTWR